MVRTTRKTEEDATEGRAVPFEAAASDKKAKDTVETGNTTENTAKDHTEYRDNLGNDTNDTRKGEDRQDQGERTDAQKERDEKRKLQNEHAFAAFGTEDDPYGRTNHAMTADEVAREALKEGTLRPDGRPIYSVFYDDVAADEENRRREFIENQQWNQDGTRVDVAAMAASQHPVTAERAEPLTGEVLVTDLEGLEKVNDAQLTAGDIGKKSGEDAKDTKDTKDNDKK